MKTTILRNLPVVLAAVAVLATGCGADDGGPSADLVIEVETAPTPPIVGPVRVVVTVTDPSGERITDAEVRIQALGSDFEVVAASAEPSGDGRYVVARLEFPEGGEWTLTTRVQPSRGDEAVHREVVRVLDGGPSATP